MKEYGFSLVELMIVVAIIGIVSTVALPAYQNYINAANMTKVTANFEEAIRLTRATFAKDSTRISMGIPATAPTTVEAWILLFDKATTRAPGGGPSYITSKKGDSSTGAIGVNYKPPKPDEGKSAEIKLRRPAYLALVEREAKIKVDKLTVKDK